MSCLCDDSLNYNHVDQEIKNNVVTPYYKEAIKDRGFEWYDQLKSNFNSYQLFVLKTRLQYAINPNFDIVFNSYQDYDKIRYILQADNLTDEYGQLSKKEVDDYQNLVDGIIKNYPNHCTLIHINQPFYSTFTKKIDRNKIICGLPHCYKHFIDTKYQPILLPNQLLVDLSNEVDYLTTFRKLQNCLILHLSN
jgi:hypothetical protein